MLRNTAMINLQTYIQWNIQKEKIKVHYEQTRGFSIERLIWATPLCNKELLFSLKNAYILKRENYKKH